MNVSTTYLRGLQVVSVSGVVDRHAAGQLSDALIDSVGKRSGTLIVDLSEVRLMTRAGARGLVVAAKLLESGRGRMRICGAKTPVDIIIRGLAFNHLLKLDATIADSITALFPDQFTNAARDLVPMIRNGSAIPSARGKEQHSFGSEAAVVAAAA